MNDRYSMLTDHALFEEIIYTFLPGVVAGILVSLILYLFLLYLRRRRRRLRSSIQISGEHGDVVLSQRAVRDFVLHSLMEFRHSTVKHVYVTSERGAYTITVDMELAPGTQLRTEKDKMQTRIKNDLVDLAGLREPATITLNILSNDADMRPANVG